MRDNDTSGPAFPSTESHPSYGVRGTNGMSLRDWFAGMAMQGMYANRLFNNAQYNKLAFIAYTQADAMLESRKPTEPLNAGKE